MYNIDCVLKSSGLLLHVLGTLHILGTRLSEFVLYIGVPSKH